LFGLRSPPHKRDYADAGGSATASPALFISVLESR